MIFPFKKIIIKNCSKDFSQKGKKKKIHSKNPWKLFLSTKTKSLISQEEKIIIKKEKKKRFPFYIKLFLRYRMHFFYSRYISQCKNKLLSIISFFLLSGRFKCREEWPNASSERAYNLFLDVILLLVPLVIMTLAYSLIVSKLWKGLKHEIKHNSNCSRPGKDFQQKKEKKKKIICKIYREKRKKSDNLTCIREA